jgi:hypothetical protein
MCGQEEGKCMLVHHLEDVVVLGQVIMCASSVFRCANQRMTHLVTA